MWGLDDSHLKGSTVFLSSESETNDHDGWSLHLASDP